MGDTPRTDAAQFAVDCPGMLDPVFHVSAEFARQLERELNAAQIENAKLQVDLEQRDKDYENLQNLM